VDVATIGKGIGDAGGGIMGALAILMVGLGLGMAYLVWKEYQKKITEDKTEDQKRIDKLEKEVEELREEGRQLREEGRIREDKLIQLVAEGQKIQTQQNQILAEINTKQTEIKTEISYIKGQIGGLVGVEKAKENLGEV